MLTCFDSYGYFGIAVSGSENMIEGALPKEISETIQKWLIDDGWTLQPISLPDFAWVLVAEDQLGRKIVVGQKSDREDELIISASSAIGEPESNKINQLSEKERNEFLWELRFELLRTELEFSGVELPLSKIEVSNRIFSDALSKDSFLQRTSQVRKGSLIILLMVARKFGQQPPRRQMGFKIR